MSELKLCKDCAYFCPRPDSIYYLGIRPDMCCSPGAMREPLYGNITQSALELRIDQDACGADAVWFVDRPVQPPHRSIWVRLMGRRA